MTVLVGLHAGDDVIVMADTRGSLVPDAMRHLRPEIRAEFDAIFNSHGKTGTELLSYSDHSLKIEPIVNGFCGSAGCHNAAAAAKGIMQRYKITSIRDFKLIDQKIKELKHQSVSENLESTTLIVATRSPGDARMLCYPVSKDGSPRKGVELDKGMTSWAFPPDIPSETREAVISTVNQILREHLLAVKARPGDSDKTDLLQKLIADVAKVLTEIGELSQYVSKKFNVGVMSTNGWARTAYVDLTEASDIKLEFKLITKDARRIAELDTTPSP